MSKPFSDEERAYLVKIYARKGKKYCAKKLKRSSETVKRHVNLLGLEFGETEHLTRLRYAAGELNVYYQTLLKQARASRLS